MQSIQHTSVPTRTKRIRALSAVVFVLILAAFSKGAVAQATIQTLAGTGMASDNGIGKPLNTNIGNPFGVEIGPDGDLYICEVSNHRLWQLDLRNSELSIVAGTGEKGYSGDGGIASRAKLNEPYEVRFASNGDIYFVEMQNHVVRKIDAMSRFISTVAGCGLRGFSGDGGPATEAKLNRPHSIALDARYLYVADIGNHRIRRVDLRTNHIESFAGTDDKRVPTDGAAVTGNPVLGPRALFIKDQTLWVALREGHSVWSIDLDKPTWNHIAGTGTTGFSGDGGNPRKATFNGPKGIAVGPQNDVYVVDTENQAIRVIHSKSQKIDTIAGVGPGGRGFQGENDPAKLAHLNRPHGVCIDAVGNVYIGDSENHRVRRVIRSGAK